MPKCNCVSQQGLCGKILHAENHDKTYILSFFAGTAFKELNNVEILSGHQLYIFKHTEYTKNAEENILSQIITTSLFSFLCFYVLSFPTYFTGRGNDQNPRPLSLSSA